MSSYRFCRTDDIGLLVDALNRCWAPYFPGEPPATPASFKRSIRDLQVWCSSCMVAFSGPDPIGVLIGAKRPSGTLVHRIAVHPDHRRQGHGRHLLASLGSKLAILGPPRIVAEVPETLAPACELFGATGYVQEALLTDYVVHLGEHDLGDVSGPCPERAADGSASRRACPERAVDGSASRRACPERAVDGSASRRGFVIPVTVDDLAANGLLDDGHSPACWERSVETLTARKDDVVGFAVASDERIEAYLLCLTSGEIASLRSFAEDGGPRLKQLVSQLRAQGFGTLRLLKVHPGEVSKASLESLGFRAVRAHRLYAARPKGA